MNMHRADLHAPSADAAGPMADIRETAQWYTVNGGMSMISKVLDSLQTTDKARCYQHGSLVNWERLPMVAKYALRRELYRIRSIGEAIDRENGRK